MTAYIPLTNEQKSVWPNAKILPSGEQHFDGFYSGLNIEQIPNKLSGINDLDSSGINLIYIEDAKTLTKTDRIDFSQFSSSEADTQTDNSIDSNMFIFRPYIHYYPLINYQNLSSYNNQVEVLQAINISYPLSFSKSTKKSIYG